MHDKLLIVQPKVGKNQLNKFVKSLEDEGVKHIYADPKAITDKKSKLKTVFTTNNADYIIPVSYTHLTLPTIYSV